MHQWVAEAAGRITVLLGAGASYPAGLPLSLDLTEIVVSQIDNSSRAPEAWKIIRPRGKDNAVDVEHLYREIDDLRRVLIDGSAWHGVGQLPTVITSTALEMLQFDILDVTTSALRTRSVTADVGYFGALLSAAVVGIATLNFDTLLERAARERGTAVVTGADSWDGGFHWPISQEGTQLLKLHGSLDWIQEIRKAGPIPITGRRTLTPVEENRLGGGGIFSGLQFGLENKLTQEGPMPALLEAFTRFLEQSDLVVVVGYSFRDEHVDAMLNRWAALNDAGRLIVVDPMREPNDMDALEQSGSAWFRQMVAGLRDDCLDGRSKRICVLRESADSAFDTLFSTATVVR